MQHITKHKSILEVLRSAHPKLRKLILKNCDSKVICALVEIIHNLLHERVKVSPSQKKRLAKYKNLFRLINQKCIRNKKHINKKKARQYIVQSGGALPFLIPLIAPLIAKAALAGAVSTGVGLATKKILDK